MRTAFIRLIALSLAYVGVYSAITGAQLKPSTSSQRVCVGIAQSPDTPATYEEVRALVDEAIKSVLGPGGFANLIKPTDRVFIKINSNVGAVPGGQPLGYLTDPRVARAVAEAVVQVVPADQVQIGDAISHIGSAKYTEYKSAGFDTDLDGFLDGVPGVRMVCLNEPHDPAIGSGTAYVTRYDNAPGHQRTTWYIPNLVAEADVRISVPVLKSHDEAGLTAGMKNSIGLIPCDIYYGPVYSRSSEVLADIHRDYPNGPPAAVADINALVPYDFTVIDALTAHRYGPWVKEPDRIYPHVILAATDTVAVDTVAAAMVGWNPLAIDYLVYAHNDSTGMSDTGYINVQGRSVAEIRADLAQRYPDKFPFPLGYGSRINNRQGVTAVETVPPQVTLITSLPDSTLNGQVQVKFNCSDNTGVAKAELYVDQEPAGFLPYPSSPASFTWNTSNAGTGPHTLEVRVYDGVFNEASAKVTTKIEEPGPTVGMHRPE